MGFGQCEQGRQTLKGRKELGVGDGEAEGEGGEGVEVGNKTPLKQSPPPRSLIGFCPTRRARALMALAQGESGPASLGSGCRFAGEIQAQGDRDPHGAERDLEPRPRAPSSE